jgi:Tfp pilus assembly protein PilO
LSVFLQEKQFLINENQGTEDTTKAENSDLTTKFNSLSSLQNSNLPTGSVSTALPNGNSSFLALSQLQKLATETNLTFTTVRIGPESSQSAIFHTDINIDLSAPFAQIANLIKRIPQVAPIMRVKSIKSLAIKDVSETTLIVSTYWAPFPAQLPPLSKELQQPTEEEQSILTKISALEKPPVGENLTPQTTSTRSDPFNFQ